MNILHALDNREYYENYNELINTDILSTHEQAVFNALGHYFSSTSNDKVDWKTFADYIIYRSGQTISSEVGIKVKVFCDNIISATPTMSASEMIKDFVDRKLMLELGGACLLLAERSGGIEVEDVENIIDKWKATRSEADVPKDLKVDTDFIDGYINLPEGLDWKLNALNESFGPLNYGLIVFGARPDSGKTTLLLSEAINFTEQLASEDRNVCWFHNEENVGRAIIPRIGCIVGGHSPNKVLTPTGRKEVLDSYIEWQTKNNWSLKIYPDSSGFTVNQVESFARTNNAGVIFIDQLGKVAGYESKKHSTSDIDRFAKVCKHLRRIGEDFAPVVGTIWADGTAEGVAYINMNQLYGSKTALQGEADGVVTIGRIDNTPKRYLSVVKNKIPHGNPTKANAKYEVSFNPITGEWR